MRTTVFLVLLSGALLRAQSSVDYTVRFPDRAMHYLEVEAAIPSRGNSMELFLPVWTPGSYLIREYARNVEGFAAHADGRTLRWEKTRKNRWRVETGGASKLTVRYRVYAHEPAVQGNWVDAGFAMLNGAPTFLTVVGELKRPHRIQLVLPANWQRSISGMKSDEANRYLATDYDEVVDSPIYAGNAPIHEFEVDGKKHYLVNEGEGPMWDGPASAREVKKIVEEYRRMWGFLPYDRYVFFNMLVESGGGLEHKTSTWMNSSKWAWANTQETPFDAPPGASRANRVGWLGLVSHEYFHLWNVKRLRPQELGPFDYENEVHTKSLWVAEGLTSYYGPLAVRRAGLSSRDSLLRSLSTGIRSLQNNTGRLVQPLETSSFDAWIKHYRPDENSSNTAISYYTKGAIAGLLLDAHIRRRTNGAKTLDDVMKLAYERHSGPRGFTPAEFRKAASDVGGVDLDPWFQRVLESTEDLDYAELLEYYGLRFRPNAARQDAPARIDTGLVTRTDAGRMVVSQVRRGTPAYRAGFNVNDEILGINEYRVRPDQWTSRLEAFPTGTSVSILLARRDQLIRLDLALEPDGSRSWLLEPNPEATEEQKRNLKEWLRE